MFTEEGSVLLGTSGRSLRRWDVATRGPSAAAGEGPRQARPVLEKPQDVGHGPLSAPPPRHPALKGERKKCGVST